LLPAAVVFAGGSADWVEVPYDGSGCDWWLEECWQYEGEGHCTFDLRAIVDEGDRWTSAYALAHLTGNADCDFMFWEHPVGGDVQPNPVLFGAYYLLQYDSFWTCTEEYPNPNIDPARNATTFAEGSPLQKTPTLREAEWYADPELPNADGGEYSIARYNVMGVCPEGRVSYETPYGVACELVIEGALYFDSTGDSPWPYELYIPLCWYATECPGDLDGDRGVDLADLAILLSHYGDSGASHADGDLDDDGDVDIQDLATLLGVYGTTCS
jgi:hypothetical protein